MSSSGLFFPLSACKFIRFCHCRRGGNGKTNLGKSRDEGLPLRTGHLDRQIFFDTQKFPVLYSARRETGSRGFDDIIPVTKTWACLRPRFVPLCWDRA